MADFDDNFNVFLEKLKVRDTEAIKKILEIIEPIITNVANQYRNCLDEEERDNFYNEMLNKIIRLVDEDKIINKDKDAFISYIYKTCNTRIINFLERIGKLGKNKKRIPEKIGIKKFEKKVLSMLNHSKDKEYILLAYEKFEENYILKEKLSSIDDDYFFEIYKKIGYTKNKYTNNTFQKLYLFEENKSHIEKSDNTPLLIDKIDNKEIKPDENFLIIELRETSMTVIKESTELNTNQKLIIEYLIDGYDDEETLASTLKFSQKEYKKLKKSAFKYIKNKFPDLKKYYKDS